MLPLEAARPEAKKGPERPLRLNAAGIAIGGAESDLNMSVLANQLARLVGIPTSLVNTSFEGEYRLGHIQGEEHEAAIESMQRASYVHANEQSPCIVASPHALDVLREFEQQARDSGLEPSRMVKIAFTERNQPDDNADISIDSSISKELGSIQLFNTVEKRLFDLHLVEKRAKEPKQEIEVLPIREDASDIDEELTTPILVA